MGILFQEPLAASDGFRDSIPSPTEVSREFDLDFLIDKLLMAEDASLGTDEVFGPFQENLGIIHTCIRVWIDSAISCQMEARHKQDSEYTESDDTKYIESVLRFPNTEDHWPDFYEKIYRSLGVYGNCYLRNFYSQTKNDSKIREAYVLNPKKIKITRRPDGRISHDYDGQTHIRKMHRPGITHIKLNTYPDSLKGISSLLLLYKEVKAARLALKHTNKTLRDGGTSRIGLKRSVGDGAPHGMSDLQNKTMVDDAKNQSTGPESIGRFLKIPDGYEIVELPISEDAEFLLTNKALRDEIAAAFQVPPHKYNNLDKANLNNIRVTENHFLKNTMRPLFERVTAAITGDWLPSESDIVIRHNMREAFRAIGLEDSRDQKARLEAGRMTMNDLRRQDGMPTFDDPDADKPFPLVELEHKIAAGRVSPNAPGNQPDDKKKNT